MKKLLRTNQALLLAHLHSAEVVGRRQQPLHFMAEHRSTVTHLHASFSSPPLQAKLCHRCSVAWRSLEDRTRQITHRHSQRRLWCLFNNVTDMVLRMIYVKWLCGSEGERVEWSWLYLPGHDNTAGGLACGGGSSTLLRRPGAGCDFTALWERSELSTREKE